MTYRSSDEKTLWALLAAAFFTMLVLILGFSMVTIIETGERGVVLRFGSYTGIMDEGLNFKAPFIDSVKIASIRDKTLNLKGDVSSSDIQTIQLETSLIYAYDPDEVGHIYQKYGQNIEGILIRPTIAEITNSVIALYPIEKFVEKRAEISKKILDAFVAKTKGSGLIVKSFLITNHDFAMEFEKAIEAKKVAEQGALKAKYDLERVTLEAKAQLEKQKSLNAMVLQEKAIDKWDGKLPTYFSGNGQMPFVFGSK